MGNHISASQRINESLYHLIASMEAGARLPSEPKLAMQLGVSRATLREAMRTFETQGLIRRKQGAGTYVLLSTPVIESGLEVLESIETLAQRIGLQVSVGALELEHRPPLDEEARALDLHDGSWVIRVARTILAGGKPAAYLIDVLPDDVIRVEDLQDQFSGSVLDLMLKRGDPQLATSRCEINAVTASPELARAFGIQKGDVLLRFVSWLFDASGRSVDYSFSYFLPGYYRFHVVRRVGHT
ncbi:MAG: GntR family transcriptional regulator [Anaerolineales bacterium]|nr:GntR family transcriptional regulator [Anaerolineales bacterium]